MLTEQETSVLKMVEERKVPIGRKDLAPIFAKLKAEGYIHYPANKGWWITAQGAEYLHPAAPVEESEESMKQPNVKLTRKERNQILWDKHLEEWVKANSK